MSLATHPYAVLPDPVEDAGFYKGVPSRRLFAWIIDLFIIGAIVGVAVPLSGFTGLFFLAPLTLAISFIYRAATISARGGTWGMQLAGIELRTRSGDLPDTGMAMLHTAGFLTMTMIAPLQLISVGTILFSARRQGLHDMILGTVMIRTRLP